MEPVPQCDKLADYLLQRFTPPDGAAAMMLRHPIGPVYFPLALQVGKNLGKRPQLILKHYFLFSLSFERSDPIEITLTDDSPFGDLVLYGKLAMALFDRGPVVVRLFPCGSGADVLFCQLERARDARSLTDEPNSAALDAIANCVATWQWCAEVGHTLPFDDSAHASNHVVQLLSDAEAVPPYFPILYAAVDHTADARAKQHTKGKWTANALSHNCYLLADRKRLVTDYVANMFQLPSDAVAYLDEGPASSSQLAKAIASVCIDLVHRIGTLVSSWYRATKQSHF